MNNSQPDSHAEFPRKLWVLGDGGVGFLALADVIFDDVRQVAVSQLDTIGDGYVAFTEATQTVAMVRDVLGERRLPLVKIDQWDSVESYDAEWPLLPSTEQVDELLSAVFPRQNASVAPVAAAAPVAKATTDPVLARPNIDVQRFLPYATISFFCLAVVAIWYAVYLTDKHDQKALQMTMVKQPPSPIIEPLPPLQSGVVAAEKFVVPELVAKSQWVVPEIQQLSEFAGELHWLVADKSRVHAGVRIATIALPADMIVLNTALAFKQQVVAGTLRKQNEYDASYEAKIMSYGDDIRNTSNAIDSLDRDLDAQARALSVMRSEAANHIRSFTELKPFENELANGQLQRAELFEKMRTVRKQKAALENGGLDFSNDASYLSLLAHADNYIESASKSLATINVYAHQSGVIQHLAQSAQQVVRGENLCSINNIDMSHFVCSIADRLHHSSYRDGDFFLRLGNQREYLLSIHSETWDHGVFTYKLKMDVIRHHEVLDVLDSKVNYDIVFRPR